MKEDYVLGTHDEELERLGLQHRVWRRRALDAWLDAGFTAGQMLLDIGCGPGYASLDLAEIAGADGRVIALDRSTRFLSALRAAAAQRGHANITTRQIDLDGGTLSDDAVDGAWVRWVFSFVTKPRDLLRRARAAMKPGAPLVIHEYFDYRTWRFSPPSDAFDVFVSAVMRSWRADGGEPDIGLDLLRWLPEEGFRVRRVRPIVEIISPEHFLWQWPRSFVMATGVDRLINLGYLTADEGRAVKEEFARRETTPGTRMVTPAVIELIADAI